MLHVWPAYQSYCFVSFTTQWTNIPEDSIERATGEQSEDGQTGLATRLSRELIVGKWLSQQQVARPVL